MFSVSSLSSTGSEFQTVHNLILFNDIVIFAVVTLAWPLICSSLNIHCIWNQLLTRSQTNNKRAHSVATNLSPPYRCNLEAANNILICLVLCTFNFTFVFAARRHSVSYADGCITYERVCPSVCLSSVTRGYCVETNEATIMRFSPSGRTIILVSGEVKIAWKFSAAHP